MQIYAPHSNLLNQNIWGWGPKSLWSFIKFFRWVLCTLEIRNYWYISIAIIQVCLQTVFKSCLMFLLLKYAKHRTYVPLIHCSFNNIKQTSHSHLLAGLPVYCLEHLPTFLPCVSSTTVHPSDPSTFFRVAWKLFSSGKLPQYAEIRIKGISRVFCLYHSISPHSFHSCHMSYSSHTN